MSLEIYWKKAIEQTRLSIDDESLYPLKTDIITRDLYEKDDFIIRKLDTSKFNKKKIYGPKQNPFCPWEKILEIDKIGDNHQLILNKYPVQKGHVLLITNEWKPQNGWLDINDWRAIQQVNKDTSGLWFFNSSPIAGASQPHRHFQLLRRSRGEISCPREKWFLEMNSYQDLNSKLKKSIINFVLHRTFLRIICIRRILLFSCISWWSFYEWFSSCYYCFYKLPTWKKIIQIRQNCMGYH